MPSKKWADLTPEEQEARKLKLKEGRENAAAIRKATAAAAKLAAEAAKPEVPAEAVTVKSIAVPGVVMDDQGNRWVIPAETLADDRILHKPLFNVPNAHPDFYYQFERESEAAAMMANPDFPMVPVTLKEVGLDKFHASGEYGLQKDQFYRLHDSVCMKIPKVLEQRRRKAEKRMVDATVAETARSSKVKADGPDHQTRVEMVRGDTMIRRPAQQGA